MPNYPFFIFDSQWKTSLLKRTMLTGVPQVNIVSDLKKDVQICFRINKELFPVVCFW